jgi:type I restriction enzyme R subunit
MREMLDAFSNETLGSGEPSYGEPSYGEASYELEDLLGSVKKWTSRRIRLWLATQPDSVQPAGPPHNRPRFWQQESYDRIVRDIEELTAFRRYIARNPLEAKLRDGEYIYYAAPWLDAYADRPAPP